VRNAINISQKIYKPIASKLMMSIKDSVSETPSHLSLIRFAISVTTPKLRKNEHEYKIIFRAQFLMSNKNIDAIRARKLTIRQRAYLNIINQKLFLEGKRKMKNKKL
jgi:hypothetical protein